MLHIYSRGRSENEKRVYTYEKTCCVTIQDAQVTPTDTTTLSLEPHFELFTACTGSNTNYHPAKFDLTYVRHRHEVLVVPQADGVVPVEERLP